MFADKKLQYRDKFTIGFTYWADIYCYECGAGLPDIDPEGNDKHPVATWDRADLLDSNCGECDAPIDKW